MLRRALAWLLDWRPGVLRGRLGLHEMDPLDRLERLEDLPELREELAGGLPLGVLSSYVCLEVLETALDVVSC